MVGLGNLVSKAFRGRTGTAYLFNKVEVNLFLYEECEIRRLKRPKYVERTAQSYEFILWRMRQ